MLKNPINYDYDDEYGDSCYEQDGEFRGYKKVVVNHNGDTSSSGSDSYDEEDEYWNEDDSGELPYNDGHSSTSSGSSNSSPIDKNFSSTSDESIGSIAEEFDEYALAAATKASLANVKVVEAGPIGGRSRG